MIYSLSVAGLAKMLLYIIGVYFVIKILSRLLAPFLIKYAARKMEDRFGQQFNQQRPQQNQSKQKEGETVIDKMPSKENSSNKNVGEYIDYEEID